MKILITSAMSDLSRKLAADLSADHEIRLTDETEIETDFEFVRSDLNHDESTDQLVQNCTAVIHVDQSNFHDANLAIDRRTRCTYNLLIAAEKKIKNFIYLSTIDVFANLDHEKLTVSPRWRPRPTTEPRSLSKYLGECVCLEFARENRVPITILRETEIGKDRLTSAIKNVLDSPRNWQILHV